MAEKPQKSPAEEGLPEVYIDDMLMTLKYYVDETQAHIHILDSQVCVQCEGKGCVYFCPVGAYRVQPDGTVQVSFQSCVECGSCRLMCPHRNVDWTYPRGGYGIAYKFG